jgi:hypothetical protein
MVACHAWPTDKSAGPQPSGPVQPKRQPIAQERGACAGRTHGMVTAWWPHAQRRGGVAGPRALADKVPWERRCEHHGGDGNAPYEVAVAMAHPSNGLTCGGRVEAAR